jgi:hypothetical protein
MTKLENKAVQNLIEKSVKAGAKPTIDKLMVLAVATSNHDAFRFLKIATLDQKVGVKNAIAEALTMFGKEVEPLTKDKEETRGNMLGMAGQKESAIAENKNEHGLPEPVERTTEEQKNIKERRKTEEFHPETSDRKTVKTTVDDPLKEKTDPKIEEILERGPKAQEKMEKTDQRKAVKEASKAIATADPHGTVDRDLNRNAEPKPHDDSPLMGKESEVREEWERKMATIIEYAARIRKGEAPEKVLSQYLVKELSVDKEKKSVDSVDKEKKKAWGTIINFADVNVGDTVTVQTQSGNTGIKVDMVGIDPQGKTTSVGKDSSNQVRVIPAGTPVQTTLPQQGMPTEQPQQSTTQMAPAAPAAY